MTNSTLPAALSFLKTSILHNKNVDNTCTLYIYTFAHLTIRILKKITDMYRFNQENGTNLDFSKSLMHRIIEIQHAYKDFQFSFLRFKM